MNSGEIMVIIIVAMVMIASVVRAGVRGALHPTLNNGDDSGEAKRLREEVAQLKDRIKVLERITVEKENSLAKQIDELRDR